MSTQEKLDVNPINDYLTIKYNKKIEEKFNNNFEKTQIDNKTNIEFETTSVTLEDTKKNATVFNQIVKDAHTQNWMEEESENMQKWSSSNLTENLPELNINKQKSTKKLENTLFSKSKVKFTAVSLKSGTECEEPLATEEIETWMSKKDNENIAFQDILNNINEIEKSICLNAIDMPQDVPQHDIETTPEPESCDDISSILKVLEAEDKKSRNFIFNFYSKFLLIFFL